MRTKPILVGVFAVSLAVAAFSTNFCDAVSSTASHSLMLACTFSPVSGSSKSVITPHADGLCGG